MALSFAAAAATASATTAPEPTPSAPSTSSGIQHLILDAGPLLSLTPLRHLASTFHTTPAVLAELRDPRAREHWERLALQGVDIRVAPPSAEAVAAVTAFAKKTGDYNVLSSTDLGVIALTWQWEVAVNGKEGVRSSPGQVVAPREQGEKKGEEEKQEGAGEEDGDSSDGEEVEVAPLADEEKGKEVEEVVRGVEALSTETEASEPPAPEAEAKADTPMPTPEAAKAAAAAAAWGDDDEGEWITPANVKKHRNRDLGLVPSTPGKASVPLAAAAMTGDYAVQNVLLGMGLGLVGEGGKRISRVKSYVLRCHACFKLCKDSSKRFCPSCGNSSLLRATVTTSAATGKQTVHLKKNFQYRTRGTKYSIPAPTPGAAKGQKKGGSGLILREDQAEWQEAMRAGERERRREEKRIVKGDGGWMDPDVSLVWERESHRSHTVAPRDRYRRHERQGTAEQSQHAFYRPRAQEPQRNSPQQEEVERRADSLTARLLGDARPRIGPAFDLDARLRDACTIICMSCTHYNRTGQVYTNTNLVSRSRSPPPAHRLAQSMYRLIGSFSPPAPAPEPRSTNISSRILRAVCML